jgi:hypothetical protein
VSFSPETRAQALCDALALMLARLGESAICDELFYLKESHFVKSRTLLGANWRSMALFKAAILSGTRSVG